MDRKIGIALFVVMFCVCLSLAGQLIKCQICGENTMSDKKFCGNCGQKITITQEKVNVEDEIEYLVQRVEILESKLRSATNPDGNVPFFDLMYSPLNMTGGGLLSGASVEGNVYGAMIGIPTAKVTFFISLENASQTTYYNGSNLGSYSGTRIGGKVRMYLE